VIAVILLILTLEVEALLENKDIGFVEEGQRVEVKIDAFPFTKYGTIDGELIDISNDAVMDETKGLVFKTQVALARSVIQVSKRQVDLTPGMSVTVEVKTGKRRVIEYFLAPLLRYKQESIRER
jgi:hemolysin D